MTEHTEKLVREWRKEGIDPMSCSWILATARFLKIHPSEFKAELDLHHADIKNTLYGL